MLNDQTVLVIGATRGTGLQIVPRLLRRGGRVRVLSRSAERARRVLPDDVEVVEGDVRHAATLVPAVDGVTHVISTAGVTRRPAGEAEVRATVYDGVLHTLAAAHAVELPGRLVLMGAIGTTRGSPLSWVLNLLKGNTLRWRRRAEEAVRRSGVDYTIVHAGILTDHPAGHRPVELSQQQMRMWPHRRIGRADAAEVLVQALLHEEARNTTMDAVWGSRGPEPSWAERFAVLSADPPAREAL